MWRVVGSATLSWVGRGLRVLRPLPFANAAKAEAKYALDTLGASGVGVLSNHEGVYLGNSQLAPFFDYLNSRRDYTIIYVHPSVPYLRQNGGAKLVEANPTRYISGLFEFFFETGRVFMDLTMSGGLSKWANLRWIAAHVGGTFPTILDRMIKSLDSASSEKLYKGIYTSRIWWDSAGPAYPRQVNGLLAYVNQTQLLLGSDYPYAPMVSYARAINGLLSDTAVNVPAIYHDNAIALLGNRLRWH